MKRTSEVLDEQPTAKRRKTAASVVKNGIKMLLQKSSILKKASSAQSDQNTPSPIITTVETLDIDIEEINGAVDFQQQQPVSIADKPPSEDGEAVQLPQLAELRVPALFESLLIPEPMEQQELVEAIRRPLYYVNNAQMLRRLLEHCSSDSTPFVPFDVELDSYNFENTISLVQLTVGHKDFVIDVRRHFDLQPLWEALRHRVWVFHNATGDLRDLRALGAPMPDEVFDTDIACRLLGEPRASLQFIVARLQGVFLNKKYQRSRWSNRPLSSDPLTEREMLEYAANDTRYLSAIYSKLRQRLERCGRLEWMSETVQMTVAKVSAPAAMPAAVAELPSGAQVIYSSMQPVVECEARRINKPMGYVMARQTMVSLARWAHHNRQLHVTEWSGWYSLRMPRTVKQSLAAAVQSAKLCEYPPDRSPLHPPIADHSLRVQALLRARDLIASRLRMQLNHFLSAQLAGEIARQPHLLDDPSVVYSWLAVLVRAVLHENQQLLQFPLQVE